MSGRGRRLGAGGGAPGRGGALGGGSAAERRGAHRRNAARPDGGGAAARRGGAAGGCCGRVGARSAIAARGLRLDLADRLFEREPLAGDFGFLQRRIDAAQLRDQRRARPLIERTAGLAGVLFETGDGAGNQRVIVGHASCIGFASIVPIPIVSCLERILHQNCVLALRAGRQQGHRAADQFLDPPYILDRLGRQIGPGAGAGGRLLPALDGLVDRLDPGLGMLAGRKIVDLAPVQAVADADLDLRRTRPEYRAWSARCH